jgi:hypothetical protein
MVKVDQYGRVRGERIKVVSASGGYERVRVYVRGGPVLGAYYKVFK